MSRSIHAYLTMSAYADPTVYAARSASDARLMAIKAIPTEDRDMPTGKLEGEIRLKSVPQMDYWAVQSGRGASIPLARAEAGMMAPWRREELQVAWLYLGELMEAASRFLGRVVEDFGANHPTLSRAAVLACLAGAERLASLLGEHEIRGAEPLAPRLERIRAAVKKQAGPG